MMKLLIILKQLNTSFKEFVFKRYTLKGEEFKNITYRKITQGIKPWSLRVPTTRYFAYCRQLLSVLLGYAIDHETCA